MTAAAVLQFDPQGVSNRKFWAAQERVSSETGCLCREFPILGLRTDFWIGADGFPVTQIYLGESLLANVFVRMNGSDDGIEPYVRMSSVSLGYGRNFRLSEMDEFAVDLWFLAYSRIGAGGNGRLAN